MRTLRIDAQDVAPITYIRFWRTDRKTKHCVCVMEFAQPQIILEVGDMILLHAPEINKPIELVVFMIRGNTVRTIFTKELEPNERKEEAATSDQIPTRNPNKDPERKVSIPAGEAQEVQ